MLFISVIPIFVIRSFKLYHLPGSKALTISSSEIIEIDFFGTFNFFFFFVFGAALVSLEAANVFCFVDFLALDLGDGFFTFFFLLASFLSIFGRLWFLFLSKLHVSPLFPPQIT